MKQPSDAALVNATANTRRFQPVSAWLRTSSSRLPELNVHVTRMMLSIVRAMTVEHYCASNSPQEFVKKTDFCSSASRFSLGRSGRGLGRYTFSKHSSDRSRRIAHHISEVTALNPCFSTLHEYNIKGKYLQNNPAQISHFEDEEIEGLSNFLKVTQPVISGKLRLEAKSSLSAFCIHYTVWFGHYLLLQVLLDTYAHKEKLEHVWIISEIFKPFEPIGGELQGCQSKH